MTAIWAWARHELVRHRRATIALVLLIGVSGAVVLTTAAGARRSESAFDRFIESTNTADVRFQYDPVGIQDDEILAAVRADPDVELAAPVYSMLGFAEGSDYDLGIFVGPDPALFNEIDRPHLVDGRRPDPDDPHEVLVNPFTQRVLDLELGDTVTIGTFTPEQLQSDEFSEPAGPEIPLAVVGISRTAYDIADPEFSGFYATPAFYETYKDEVGGFGPTLQIATVPGVDPGDVVERVAAQFPLDEVFTSEISEDAKKVEDGTRVLAVGLSAFAAVAGLAALVAGAQALNRRMAETSDDLSALRSIGLTRSDCTLAVVLAVLPIIGVGAGVAVLLAVGGSLLMPIGLARVAEPSPGLDIDPLVLGIGALLLIVVLGACAAFGAVRATRAGLAGAPVVRPRRPTASLLASGRFSPSSQVGVSMALDPGEGRTSVPVRSAIVGAAFGVAGVVAAMTFGAGLDALVEKPASSGWNWTLSPDLEEDGDVDTLAQVDGVEDIGVITFKQVVAEGERMTGVAMRAEKGTPSFSVVSGRMPAGPREVALGPKAADRLGLSIGDPVQLDDPEGGEREAVLVGEVLMPVMDDNPFNDGIALAPDTLDSVGQSEGFDETVVTFADGIDEAEAAARVRAVLPDAMSVYAFPSPPPDVAHLEDVQFLPRVLGLFLGLLALAAVGHALATSVRRRRHDIGIIRSVGFVGRDVLGALTAQSWTLVAIGLVFGIPIGIAVGRVSWQLVADGIGVRAEASTSVAALALVAACAGLAAAALAWLPGMSAARQRAVEALRVE